MPLLCLVVKAKVNVLAATYLVARILSLKLTSALLLSHLVLPIEIKI